MGVSIRRGLTIQSRHPASVPPYFKKRRRVPTIAVPCMRQRIKNKVIVWMLNKRNVL